MNPIGTLITGRLIGWLLAAWALSLGLALGGLWLYMDGSRDAAAAAAGDVAKAQAEAACAADTKADAEAQEQAVLGAVRGALAERAIAQAELDKARDDEQSALTERLAAERRRAEQLSTRLRRHLDANPLPAACRLDAERVRLFNAARRGGTAADDATPRSGLPALSGVDLPGAPGAGAGAGWHSERGWALVAGLGGWRGAPHLRGELEHLPELRASGDLGGRDPLKVPAL